MGRVDEVQALQERLRTDTPFFAEHCLTILSEQEGLVRLRPRPWQLEFDAALEKQRAAGQPMRAIILKARKLGFSTWVQAKFMQRLSQFPYQRAVVVAHERMAATTLMDMARLMYDQLPDDQQLAELIYGPGTMNTPPFSIKPPKSYGSDTRNGNQWMTLGHKLRLSEASIYETRTAGAKGGGRATTPNMVHASEAAHYEDPYYLVGMLNAVPKVRETIVVLESTAKGFNHFYDRWSRAVQGAEDPETGGTYIPLFFGWHRNPAYSMPFPNDAARARFERTVGDSDGGGDPEEIELVEQFGVSLEQLRWRRVTRDEECGGDVEQFHQEHPATPEQAFIGSGQPVFPGILVGRAIAQAKAAPSPVLGVLRGLDWKDRPTRSGTIRVPQNVLWVPEEKLGPEDAEKWGVSNLMNVWEHPTKAGVTEEGELRSDGQYVVFADIAVGGATVDGDWHAVQVLDHVSRMQVARYRSKIPVHDLPILLFLIGLYWNTAWLAPEVNGPGQGVIDVLAADLRYPKLYRRHRRGDDIRQGVSGVMLGWLTTSQSKWLMEQTFGEALRDGTHGLRDVLTGREATKYVQDVDRPEKHGALKGANDDLLMAFMGAHRIADELRPRVERKRGQRRQRAYDPLVGY